jgi:hypothetical protein
VLKDLIGDHLCEGPVGERQPRRVRGQRDGGRGRTGLAFGAHGGEHGADRCQLAGIEVRGDDAGAPAICLERVASRAAADVEHAVARAYTELAEIDGQHPISPFIALP